jgi:hypothetical protein
VSLSYTTILNLAFLAIAALLVWRAYQTGGFAMVRHMNESPYPTPSADRHT